MLLLRRLGTLARGSEHLDSGRSAQATNVSVLNGVGRPWLLGFREGDGGFAEQLPGL